MVEEFFIVLGGSSMLVLGFELTRVLMVRKSALSYKLYKLEPLRGFGVCAGRFAAK